MTTTNSTQAALSILPKEERDKCTRDLVVFGCAFVKDGKRIDPRTVGTDQITLEIIDDLR